MKIQRSFFAPSLPPPIDLFDGSACVYAHDYRSCQLRQFSLRAPLDLYHDVLTVQTNRQVIPDLLVKIPGKNSVKTQLAYKAVGLVV